MKTLPSVSMNCACSCTALARNQFKTSDEPPVSNASSLNLTDDLVLVLADAVRPLAAGT